ncbi:MAG: 2,4-dihydroxyhept-2-ene-1,7-dioic acid aldolase [Peptococcaceae bacterium BICA1-7]|nr:MAG: 2,4-dihydroxyhept-2-ene-1,7-dioic acid aldolase [Peptococcaceae bacterium BICA1-7]HBV98549.1 2,4-dihydroxyhept-2-ene-1,7-dioic acid aldolase [Desulfotomaculum sp.]
MNSPGDSLKSKLKNRELTLGSWITLGHPCIAEIMAAAGFDWLTVDMEHSAISTDQAQQLIQVIELSGCEPLVRVGKNDAKLIGKAMDMGAHGVVVPMVNSRSDAERAVAAVKYPPLGSRGVGIARAHSYGPSFEKHLAWNNAESVVVVQIEHIDAVKNIDEILSVEGVDAFFVGPYDLSGSIGAPGQFDHPAFREALGAIERAGKMHGISAGYHVVPADRELVTDRMVNGYTFIAFSVDIIFLGDTCRKGLAGVKEYMSGGN